jgi:hypothetical protein
VNWEKVRQFVEAWAAERNWPSDLRGYQLQLVHFEREEDCRFFYPERDLLSHRAFLNALGRFVRERRAKTRRVTITPEHYRVWRVAEKEEDTPENRARYAESRYRLAPLD